MCSLERDGTVSTRCMEPTVLQRTPASWPSWFKNLRRNCNVEEERETQFPFSWIFWHAAKACAEQSGRHHAAPYKTQQRTSNLAPSGPSSSSPPCSTEPERASLLSLLQNQYCRLILSSLSPATASKIDKNG